MGLFDTVSHGLVGLGFGNDMIMNLDLEYSEYNLNTIWLHRNVPCLLPSKCPHPISILLICLICLLAPINCKEVINQRTNLTIQVNKNRT